MRVDFLCLNFPVLAFCVIRTKGNRTWGNETLACDAAIGNVEFVNVLKTTD
jgi:hypothetical protein